jgi:hypothetical protein
MAQNKTPTTIYKYRNWNDGKYGRDILNKFELYLASPSQFNDPFDSKIINNHSSMNGSERRLFIDKLLKLGIKSFDRIEPKPSYEFKVAIIEKMMIEEPLGFQNYALEAEHKVVDRIIGIISMSATWNNLLMWSHYAKEHKGYCVGFNENKMMNSGLFKSGAMVMYPKDNAFPNIHPMMDQNESFFKRTFTKSAEWKYEQEYRFLNIFTTDKQSKKNERLVKIKPSFIDEVIIGMKMPEPNVKEIVNICRKYDIKVFQAAPVDFKFELTKKEISN